MKCFHSYFIFPFFLFLLIFALFGLFLSYVTKTRENMENMENNNNNSVIILLGDSVFKNDDYVEQGKSVYSFLNKQIQQKQKDIKVYNYAVDDSTIVDVYNQINQIPIDLNNENTTIFLSIGGNDILEKFVEKENTSENTNVTLDAMFSAYKKIVKSIQTKMNKSNIVLLDVYYPYSIKLKPYIPILRTWNNKIKNYANDSSNNIQDVLKVSEFLTQPNDLVFDIEPSEIGGEKLAKYMLNT
jgi:lysophospholipase L1-like esterase